ncbi:hypothetical protein PVAP13_2KG302802 [Panicum virgatum]|uniref:Uncharacterized protein n=1 Tax=Panicum virgatum TaxID=38727 RepID=A0A8T0W6Q9_PANVG|nr:hypothetical protein PVAP13_2KG302802 [Panicum virgatum]
MGRGRYPGSRGGGAARAFGSAAAGASASPWGSSSAGNGAPSLSRVLLHSLSYPLSLTLSLATAGGDQQQGGGKQGSTAGATGGGRTRNPSRPRTGAGRSSVGRQGRARVDPWPRAGAGGAAVGGGRCARLARDGARQMVVGRGHTAGASRGAAALLPSAAQYGGASRLAHVAGLAARRHGGHGIQCSTAQRPGDHISVFKCGLGHAQPNILECSKCDMGMFCLVLVYSCDLDMYSRHL